MSKTYLSISRKWNHPQIVTKVTGDGIEVDMDMDDFLAAVRAELELELGLVNTKASVLAKIEPAFKAVIEGAKEETAKVPDLP